MELNEYSNYDAIGLANLVRCKEIKPSELAEIALQAARQLNPQLDAILETFADQVERLDDIDLPDGPFRGVPFLIKDLVLHAAGMRSDMGSRWVHAAGGVAFSHDTDLMIRFKQAGLVTLGRTTTPEFGYNVTTEPLLNGPTRNPWDVTRMAGGSSGGSCAAVAARIVPMAHANDGAGSIRLPAACCGLVGLKPTRGRTPIGPDADEGINGLGVEFAVTRTVRDSAALLDATEGPGVGEKYIIPRPERPYLGEVTTPPGKLKIAFTTEAWSGVPVDTACIKAVEEAAALCKELGHIIIQAAPEFPVSEFELATLRLWTASLSATIADLSGELGRPPNEAELEATIWAAYQFGKQMSARELLGALVVMNQVTRTVARFFLEYDVLLTPTTTTTPALLGTYDANNSDLDAPGWMSQLLSFAAFTAPFNMTGQPAISLPLHENHGLPVGVQFVGRFGDEAILFRLAGQLERASPWIDKRPSISL